MSQESEFSIKLIISLHQEDWVIDLLLIKTLIKPLFDVVARSLIKCAKLYGDQRQICIKTPFLFVDVGKRQKCIKHELSCLSCADSPALF